MNSAVSLSSEPSEDDREDDEDDDDTEEPQRDLLSHHYIAEREPAPLTSEISEIVVTDGSIHIVVEVI